MYRQSLLSALEIPSSHSRGSACQSQNAEGSLCFAVGQEMRVDELENREYPPAIKAAQIFVTGGTILIFFAVLYWTLHAWAAFLSLFGTYKVSQYSYASVQQVLCSVR